jgi:hypothetical protein
MTSPKRAIKKPAPKKMAKKPRLAPFVPKVAEELKSKGGAPKGNKYAVGNPGGGRPTTFKAEFCKITRKLCERGFTDREIADTLCISLSTLHVWKVRHEDFFESIKRGKGEADQVAENSLFKLVSGFEYETEKVFQTGVRMKTTVFQPPDPGSVKFWLQSRMSDTYREKKQQEITGDDAFLQFLDNLDERAKRERAVNVIDIKPDAIDVD